MKYLYTVDILKKHIQLTVHLIIEKEKLKNED